MVQNPKSDEGAHKSSHSLLKQALKIKNLPLFITLIATAASSFVVMKATSASPVVDQAQGATSASCDTTQTNVWEGYPVALQTGTFTAEFDATPNAAITDAVVGLSGAEPTDYTALGPIVRFSSASRAIDARNGGVYSAVNTIPYVAGQTYHFRMVVNIPAHTYSAYVTPAGGTEITIANNFAFRSEQASSASLSYWSPFSDIATFQVCNWAITSSLPATSFGTTGGVVTAGADKQAPSVPQGVKAVAASNTTVKVSWTPSTDNVGVKGYKVYQDSKMVVAMPNAGTSYMITGLVPPTAHAYTVSAYDAAGNVSAQSALAMASIGKTTTVTPPAPTPTPTPSPTPTPTVSGNYDSVVSADHPVAFWDLNSRSGAESDLTGNGNTGMYEGGVPSAATMPNGDKAADFNGSQYLTVPSNKSFSIPTTGTLTWEAWVRPDTLQFVQSASDGYVDFMGKCASYGPTCEWESRMYDLTTAQGRSSRFSAYVFNPTAGLGSGADWQPNAGMIASGQWMHVVGEYTMQSQPSGCPNTGSYPGSINIWVDGVLWNQGSHSPTGCMGQYSVKPQANNSPLNIGTMALDYWFQGAIGKVAIYNKLLTQSQIDAHYTAMTGKQPVGSCAATCSW